MRGVYLFISLLVLAIGIYMWPTVIKGQIAFPGDLLSRAYLPWSSEHKGPIHNPLLSDTFSQIFPWKKLIVEAYKKGELPLWNSHTLSGSPLLANYHSGALYPLNILLMGPFLEGWNLLLASQFLIGGLGAYFLLRSWKNSTLLSCGGALLYAFNTFGLLWWQVVHAGHVLAWIPWILVCIERFQKQKNRWYLFAAICIHFPLLTAGHFQLAVGAVLIEIIYLVFNYNLRLLLVPLLGLGLASIQIMPGLEMAKLSIREEEKAVERSNYGLIPLNQLPRLVLPDFYGHPTTANYWGSHNYLESNPYMGLVPILALFVGVMQFKKLQKVERLGVIISIVFLALAFDTSISRLIYLFKVPGLSTSGAGRLMGISITSACLLFPQLIRGLINSRKYLIWSTLVIALISLLGLTNTSLFSHLSQVIRTSAMPIFLVMIFILGTIYIRKKRALIIFLLLLGVVDLFRFGWKFTSFSEKSEVFASNPVIDQIKQDRGVYRIEKLNENLFPANTWEWYDLNMVGGYEPMAYSKYVKGVHSYINGVSEPTGSRYTMISKIDLKALGEYSVKYIILSDEKETNVKIIQNQFFKDIFTSDRDDTTIKVKSYSDNATKLTSDSLMPNIITGRITNYPGWKLFIDNKEYPIYSDERSYMRFLLTSGSHQILISFLPTMVGIGAGISLFSWLLSWYIARHWTGRNGTYRTP